MKVDTRIMEEGAAPAAGNAHLLGRGFEGLQPYLQKSRELRKALVALGKMGDKSTNRTARRLHHQLKHAEPSVTMIGQVKAGKTSLVNAMVGFPDLLPADVNPWTSVVTSLHLNPHVSQEENRASFRFFDMEEWSRLLDRGGRIGELAARAGAEEELEKVREQVIEMREKSRERLGDKFELLLGQQHDYGYFDNELIERYVCLGDDFEDDFETSQAQGRFADITKSAEVFMHRPEMPMPFYPIVEPSSYLEYHFGSHENIKPTKDLNLIRFATKEDLPRMMDIYNHYSSKFRLQQSLTLEELEYFMLPANETFVHTYVITNSLGEIKDFVCIYSHYNSKGEHLAYIHTITFINEMLLKLFVQNILFILKTNGFQTVIINNIKDVGPTLYKIGFEDTNQKTYTYLFNYNTETINTEQCSFSPLR